MKKSLLITFSAMLSALSLIIVFFMPTLNVAIWSITPLSHLFLFLAAMLSPFSALMTYCAVLLGFFLKGANPFVMARAASHIFFLVFIIISLRVVKINSIPKIILLGLASSVVHSIFEALSVILMLALGNPGSNSFYDIGVILAGGTFLHSMFDYAIAAILFIILERRKVLKSDRFYLAKKTQVQSI